MNLYYRYQDQLNTADLIEWSGDTLIGWGIRYFTGKNVNHTSGVILSSIIGSTKVRRDTWEAVGDGFHATHLSDKIKKHKGKVYWLQLKLEYDNKRVLIAEIAQELEGRPYDYWSLVRNIRRPVPINDKQIFCSEAWQIANIRAGILSKDFNGGLALRPGEFDRTELYRPPVLIYES